MTAISVVGRKMHGGSDHVEGLLVPSQNLNVLEALLLQDFLDNAKLEGVRPQDN